MNKDYDLILVDGSSYLFRAYYALPPLTTQEGHPTGAIFGVVNMLRKLISSYDFKYLAIVFDPKGKNFRHELYPEYKANRTAMPDELSEQIKPLFEIIKALGLPLIIEDGYEADDTIATIALKAKAKGLRTLISTGDKDFAQLVTKDITLVNTMNDKYMDTDGVYEKFGVKPEQIIDYLSLIGDTVDNVPGVSGVGPKTAVKWLAEYKTLDNIIANKENIKGKVGERLRESIDEVLLARKLILIKTDVNLSVDLKDLTLKEKDTGALYDLYHKYELKNFLGDLKSGNSSGGAKQASKKNYNLILTVDEFDQFYKILEKQTFFAFDLETTSLNYIDAKIVGLSFSFEPNKAYYLSTGHDYEGAPKQLDLNFVLEKLKPILTNTKIKKLGHHLKYDANVLANYDIELLGIAYDSMLESYVFDAVATRHDLSSVAKKYLKIETTEYEEVAGKGAKQINFSQVDVKVASDYSCEDADVSLKIHQKLYPQIEKDKKLLQVYQDIEMPLVPVLAKMEQIGVLLDGKLLTEQSKELDITLEQLSEKAFLLAGSEFNLNSPKQLQTILYEDLGMPVLEKTPKGQPSTGEQALLALSAQYELPEIILDYRQLTKLKTTYLDKLPLLINARTKRVHTSYHQAVTSTGRLSSTNPNLQNIPIKRPEGRRIREAFIAEKNYKILALDYSQIELRIMAHLSQDKSLLQAFANNLDVHANTAAEILGKDIKDVSSEERRHAKAVNFGLIYGMSAFGLARQLKISRADAADYIEVYFDRFKGVKKYMEDVQNMAEDKGYVETIFGRKLNLPEITSRNLARKKAAIRTAVNAPMQGSAADLIKKAMIAIHNYINEEKIDAKMIMQVHDELVFEVHKNILDGFTNSAINLMQSAAKLKVPLIVSSGIGENWDMAH